LHSFQKHYNSDPDASLEHQLNQIGDMVRELENLASDYVASSDQKLQESFDKFLEDYLHWGLQQKSEDNASNLRV